MVNLTFDECPICKEYDCVATHRCPPAWYVRITESDYYHDEAAPVRVYARDAEQAAEKFAEAWDSQDSEYTLMAGDTLTVTVSRITEPDTVQMFAVTGEMVPEYRACEKERNDVSEV